MIRLAMTEQGGAPRLVTFDKPTVTIGRAADNDLPVQGKGVSSHHCRVSRTQGGVTIEDLGSTNGTYVNRRRVTGPTVIGPTDEVVMAVYSFRVVDEVSTSAPQAQPAPAQQFVPGPAGPTMAQPAVVEDTSTAAVPRSATQSSATPSVADPAAAQWIRERDKIDVLARTWLAAGRPKKHLLRGQKLEHARKWLAGTASSRASGQPSPKKEHREFIAASSRAWRMRLFRNVSIAGVLVGVASVAGFQVYQQRGSTETDDDGQPEAGTGGSNPEQPPPPEDPGERRARSDAIAAKARSVLESDPELATLLAVEALRLVPAGEARLGEAGQVFRRATEQLRGRALRGHEGPITDVAFSGDGRWAITASVDQSARVWDLHADGATPSIALRGHGQAVRHLATARPSQWLFTAADDGSLFRWNLAESDPATTSSRLDGHDAAITAMALSADGRALVTGGTDGTVRLWDAAADPPVGRAIEGHEGAVHAVAVDGAATMVATAGADMLAHLTHLDAQQQPSRRVRLEGHEGAVLDVAVAPDRSWVLTASEDATARLWDPSRRYPGLTMRILAGHDAAVHRVRITEDSKLALTAGRDHKLLVWNLESKNPELGATNFELHQGDIRDLTSTGPGSDPKRPRTRYAATGSADGSAHTLDLEVRERALDGVRLQVDNPVEAVAFSGDGRWLLTGAASGEGRLWDHRAKQPGGPSRVGRGHLSQVLDVAVNGVGTRMATAGADGTARIWDLLQSGPLREIAVLPAHEGRVRAVAFSPDAELLATAGDDGVVRLWKASVADPAAGHRALSGHGSVINDLAFTPDGRVLISTSADRSVRLWKMTREPEKDVVVLDHGDEVNAMALSDSGRWLFTATVSKLRLFDLQAEDPAASGRAIKHPHDRDLRAVAISERGTYGASSSEDAVVVLWNFAQGGEAVRLRQHDQPADALAFSPDGRWLATGSRGSVIRLYDLTAEHPEDRPLELQGHEQRIGSLRFARRGTETWLVSAGNDKTIRLWDLSAGDPEKIETSAIVLRGHDQLVSAIELGAHAGFVVSASYDGTARSWPLGADALVDMGCSLAGRALSPEEWKQHLQGAYEPACRPR